MRHNPWIRGGISGCLAVLLVCPFQYRKAVVVFILGTVQNPNAYIVRRLTDKFVEKFCSVTGSIHIVFIYTVIRRQQKPAIPVHGKTKSQRNVNLVEIFLHIGPELFYSGFIARKIFLKR